MVMASMGLFLCYRAVGWAKAMALHVNKGRPLVRRAHAAKRKPRGHGAREIWTFGEALPAPLPTLQLPFQDQVPIAVGTGGPALRNHRSGVELLDDCGAGDDGSHFNPVALIERRFDRILRAQMDAAFAFRHRRSRLRRRR